MTFKTRRIKRVIIQSAYSNKQLSNKIRVIKFVNYITHMLQHNTIVLQTRCIRVEK